MSGYEALGDMFPELDRPITPPSTTEIYTRRPQDQSSQAVRNTINIRLVGNHPLWGHHLWNAAKCFSDYLHSRHEELCKNLRVLELGAGGALPSIIVALNGAEKVVVTDYPDAELLDNIKYNLDQNLSLDQRRKVGVEGHVWGKSVEPLLSALNPTTSESLITVRKKFDLILLSDLIFNHSEHEALLRTCESALDLPKTDYTSELGPTPCLLVFFTHHRPHLIKKDLAFFALAESRGWKRTRVVHCKMEAMFKDDPGDEEVRSTVEGWRLWR